MVVSIFCRFLLLFLEGHWRGPPRRRLPVRWYASAKVKALETKVAWFLYLGGAHGARQAPIGGWQTTQHDQGDQNRWDEIGCSSFEDMAWE